MTDTLIIGSGPAGISASLYILRAGFSVTIVGMGIGSLEKAEKIENYYGIPSPVSGRELAETGIMQAEALGAKILKKEVVGISWDNNFKVKLNDAIIDARSVVIASGSQRKKPKIKNLAEFEGKGISYCAVCDAAFFKNKRTSVLGAGEYALHEFRELYGTAGEVIVLTDGNNISAKFPDNTEIITEKVTEAYGNKVLEGVILENGRRVEISGLFIALGTAGGADLAKKLGIQTENNVIITDENMCTDIPGLFSAGDCTGGLLQVSTAVGEGAKAGMSVIKYLRNI